MAGPKRALTGAPTRQNFLKPALATLLLAVAAPMLVLSETRVKALIDEAFGGCLFVLEKSAGSAPGTVDVQGYLSGKAPAALDLAFQARKGMVKRVEFRSGILASAPTPYSSLVLHPKAGQKCPGALCGGVNAILEPQPVLPVQLNEPSPNFDYRFHVELDAVETSGTLEDALVIYSIARAGQTDVCRVEPANMFNWIARLNKLQRFFVYCAALLVFAGLVLFFKQWRSTDEATSK